MDSDAKLLKRYARTRNAQSFAELSRRYSGLVYSVSRRITGNNHDAEDVTQECFLELAKSANTITSSLPGWLHTVATRSSFNKIRTAVRQREREQGSVEIDQDQPPAWSNIAPLVDRAVQDLPEEMRGAVILHFLEGKTQAEVALRLGVNQSTVSRQLKTGVDQIRLRLRKAGITVSLALLTSLLTEQASAMAAPASVTAILGKMAVAGIRETAEVAAVAASGSASASVSQSSLFGVPLNTAIAIAAVTVAGVGVGALFYALIPSPESEFENGLRRPALSSDAGNGLADHAAANSVAAQRVAVVNGVGTSDAAASVLYADGMDVDGGLAAGRSTPAQLLAYAGADGMGDDAVSEEAADEERADEYGDSSGGDSARNAGMRTAGATTGADASQGEDGAGRQGYSSDSEFPGVRSDAAPGAGADAGTGGSGHAADTGLDINDFVSTGDRLWAFTDEGMFSYDWLRQRWTARGVDMSDLSDPERTVLVDNDGSVVYDVRAGGGRRTFVVPPHRLRSR